MGDYPQIIVFSHKQNKEGKKEQLKILVRKLSQWSVVNN